MYRFGLTVVDLERQTVVTNDVTRKVNPKDLLILSELLKRRGEILSYEDLRAVAWPDSKQDIKRSVQNAMYNLNAALEARGYIENLPNEGYRFRGDVPIDAGDPGPPSLPETPTPVSSPSVPWTQNPTILQRTLIGLGAAVLLICAAWIWTTIVANRPDAPNALHWEGKWGTAFDKVGRVVWRREFPHANLALDDPRTLQPIMRDLDNDGDTETIFAYHHVQRESEGCDLYCVSEQGQDLWRISPQQTVRTKGGKSYGPPYVVRDFKIFPSPAKDGTFWTAAVFVHLNAYTCTIVIADAKGQVKGQYWHAGHLDELDVYDLEGDGKFKILATGVRHGVEQAVLVIIDPLDANGAGLVEPRDSPFAFTGIPNALETVVYFPRSDMNRATALFNIASGLEFVRGNLQLQVYEHLKRADGYLIYTLGPRLELADIAPSAAYSTTRNLLMFQNKIPYRRWASEQAVLRRGVRVFHSQERP